VEGIRFFRFNIPRPIPRLRPHVFNLTDFGGVGDGIWMNTKAFEDAVAAIAKLGNEGGQLNVQAGVWLTAPFNLTSHMTLFLAEDVVILGVEVSIFSFIFFHIALLHALCIFETCTEQNWSFQCKLYEIMLQGF